MRLVHCADWHIGFRMFDRVRNGRNVREVDVERALTRTIDRIIDLDPELVLLAGDVFHSKRPSNQASVHLLNEIVRLRRERPTCAVVVINGNHDRAEPSYDGGLCSALSPLVHFGCSVILDWPAVVRVGDVRVVCVPEPVAHRTDLSAGYENAILLLHGEVAGLMPGTRATILDPASIGAERWQYVALGHWHERRDLWPNGGYSGSLDYTSSDIWAEARSGIPKGFLEFDTATGARTFHAVQLERPVIDLPRIDGAGMSQSQAIEAVRTAVLTTPAGAVVRQVVTDLEPGAVFDRSSVLDLHARAGALVVDLRKVGAPAWSMARIPDWEASDDDGDDANVAPCPCCGERHVVHDQPER